MALLPVSTNRTSTPLNTQRMLFQMNADQIALQRQYDQLSTGRRVLRLSDDPAAAGRALSIQRGIDYTTQLARNANTTESFYQATDDSLNRIDDSLIEARGVAVVAAQNVLSDDERAALQTTIRQNLESVVAAGNGLFRDQQLLGGILESGNPLRYVGGDVVFDGSQAVGKTKLGGGTLAAINVNGTDSLGLLSTFMEGAPLGAGLSRTTRLVDMKQGLGVNPGVIRISGGGGFTDVDLSRAATIGDIEAILDSTDIGGRRLALTISSDSVRLEYSDGLPGTLAVADAQGSTTAADLGLSNPEGFRPPPLTGVGLRPRVTAATKISDLGNGAGLNLAGGLRIDRGGQAFHIDLSGAETISDVLIRINRSDADVQAELDESRGRILLKARRSGVDYSIGENGGFAATRLGIRSATQTTRLSDLDRGRGIVLNPQGDDLVITRPDGVRLGIQLEGAVTIDDVMTRIRNHPANQDVRRVLVDLNDVGNGIQLEAPPGVGQIVVTQEGNSNAAAKLGLIGPGQTSGTSTVVAGVAVLAGSDYRPREAGGAIDTLLRMSRAVESGDIPEIERLQTKLDGDLDKSSRTRGRVGLWTQNLTQLRDATEQEGLLLKGQLSDEIDADLATVITEMNARQASLEATMRLIGQTATMTVLNYL